MEHRTPEPGGGAPIAAIVGIVAVLAILAAVWFFVMGGGASQTPDGPDIDIQVEAPEMPEVEVPDIEVPDVNVEVPDVEVPELPGGDAE